jgi:hypothetical protein
VLNYRRLIIWIIVLLVIVMSAVFVRTTIDPKVHEENITYALEFSAIDNTEIKSLDIANIAIVEERVIDEGLTAFIYTNNENSEYEGAIHAGGKSYYIGQVSMEDTPEALMGIEEIQVFGKRAVKFYGLLGANYAHAFYWLVEEKAEESIIHVDGNTTEIDLDDDGKNEIIATTGTIPETRIYMQQGTEISVCDINKSLGAKSVFLKDADSKLFEIYFESNKPEQYVYQNGSLTNK